MHLAQLRAENFRLFDVLQLEPHARLNLITGANAAGKTSLLEAIYCLARGKSFRGTAPAELAGPAGSSWAVAGDFEVQGLLYKLKVSWSRGGTRITGATGENLTLAASVREHPVQVVEPGLHRLVQEGPNHRRAYLDWGVFHVEQAFLECWRRFQRTLRQRNESLRRGVADGEIKVWHAELAAAAEQLQAYRAAHLEQLRPRLSAYTRRLLGEVEWDWELRSGWHSAPAYADVLDAQLARDRRLGTTGEGPHRADLLLRADGHRARQRVSRGQEKLLLCALVLAQAELIEQAGRPPILLLDDFSAELAPEFQRRLLGVLREYRGQCFVTAFETPAAMPAAADFSLFHVEHRQVVRC